MKHKLFFVCLSAILLAWSCGGGGGNNNPSIPVSVPPPTTIEPIYNTYFGVVDGQTPAVVGHTNMVMPLDWGNYDSNRPQIQARIIKQLQEAKAVGITAALPSVGFLLFNGNYTYRGVSDLLKFKQQLTTLQLIDMVKALYVLDEPELTGVQEAVLCQAIKDLKLNWKVPIAVIYGDTKKYFCISEYDWIGKDKYALGIGVFNEYPPINSNQRYILVPGGADPYRNDPVPFRNLAVRDTRIVAVVNFIYPDFYAGTGYLGIKSNGMLSTYCKQGALLVGKPEDKC